MAGAAMRVVISPYLDMGVETDLVSVPKEKRSVMKIEEIMGRDILCTDQDDDLKTALDRMRKNHARALPVFDPSEKDLLIGIITR